MSTRRMKVTIQDLSPSKLSTLSDPLTSETGRNSSMMENGEPKKMGYYTKSVYKKVKPLRDTLMTDIHAVLKSGLQNKFIPKYANDPTYEKAR